MKLKVEKYERVKLSFEQDMHSHIIIGFCPGEERGKEINGYYVALTTKE